MSSRYRTIAAIAGALFGIVSAAAQDTPEIPFIVPLDPPPAHYTIDCRIGIDSAVVAVNGSETVRLTNTSPRSLRYLAVAWEVDSTRTIQISIDGTPVTIPADTAGVGVPSPLVIELPSTLDQGETTTLSLDFSRTFIYDEEVTEFLSSTWFPRIIWGVQTQDNFDVRLTVPPGYALATSGRFDTTTGMYHADGVRQFGIYLASGMNAMEATAGDVLIRTLYPVKGADLARLLTETAADVVDFNRRRFGLYPSRQLSIIPGMDYPAGGYPVATSMVVIHGMEQMAERDTLHWRWITAHEIGHQYWFEYVMPELPDAIGWLMIGLGIYVDREYTRARGLSLQKHRGFLGRYLDGVYEGLDTRADVHTDYWEEIDFDFNNIVIHGKGFSIISALECVLGDELFDRIHARCLREYAGKRMGDDDFKRVCEEEYGQNLDWFFDQWVRSTRYLSYQITAQDCQRSGDEYLTEVRVACLGTMKMPIPVAAFFEDGSSQVKVTDRLRDMNIIRFTSASPLLEGRLDPDSELAIADPPPSPEELEIRRKLRSLPDPSVIDELPQLTARILEMDITETSFWGRLGRKLYSWRRYEEALQVFQRRTGMLEELDSEWAASAYCWQGHLLDLLGRRKEAVAAYQKALDINTDQDFAYDGDPVTINRQWIEERLKTPYTREDND